ncbi:MAG TPA: zinc-dependent alcohol dehydrogenase family protein [Steroidobacteraceae bacterium]|jgi:propanol-preferring alcohol dehydrogenase|nr:zinc-dependent alcohol dehydrogenase family protein [Steroidobacteraceae bacterium]
MSRPTTMRAMRVSGPHTGLRLEETPVRTLGEHDVLIKVSACGVCRTDLHVLDGELPNARYPVTPGHEIVGRIVEVGSAVKDRAPGERVGVPWLGWTCGECPECRRGLENLCELAQFTGCTVDGGYADYVVADARYCLSIPERYSDAEATPLLCAGLIGYRAYRAAGDGRRLGLYGFGAAAHLLCQIARVQDRRVFAFTRSGDAAAQQFARELGAVWAGASDEMPPEPLDAAIIFAPVGALVPTALAAVRKGGRVVCAGIHMSDIPSFPYALLWGERSVSSVANLTRADGREFMRLAADIDLRPVIQLFPLVQAAEATSALAHGELRGAAVLTTA